MFIIAESVIIIAEKQRIRHNYSGIHEIVIMFCKILTGRKKYYRYLVIVP